MMRIQINLALINLVPVGQMLYIFKSWWICRNENRFMVDEPGNLEK
jgi:hypothetical protein